jgi:hypothetical protein
MDNNEVKKSKVAIKKEKEEINEKLNDAFASICMATEVLNGVEELSKKARKYAMQILETNLKIISDLQNTVDPWALPDSDE